MNYVSWMHAPHHICAPQGCHQVSTAHIWWHRAATKCHITEWVMSHGYMRHICDVTLGGSLVAPLPWLWVMPHSHVTCMNESCHVHTWVTLNMCCGQSAEAVWHCPPPLWVMSRMNESYPAWKCVQKSSHDTYNWVVSYVNTSWHMILLVCGLVCSLLVRAPLHMSHVPYK